MKIFLSIASCLLFAGCAAEPIVTPVLPATNSDSSRALANARVARAATTQAIAHADATGQALLNLAVLCDEQIESAVTAVEADLLTITRQEQEREVAAAKAMADQKSGYENQIASIRKADATALVKEREKTASAIEAGESTFIRALRGLEFAGVIGVAVGIFLFEFSRAQGGVALSSIGEYGALACGILFLVALTATLVTSVTSSIAPWVTYCVVALMVSATVGVIATGFYLLWLHRKTIVEQAKDTAVSVLPNVAFPKPVEKVIAGLAGSEAALPVGK